MESLPLHCYHFLNYELYENFKPVVCLCPSELAVLDYLVLSQPALMSTVELAINNSHYIGLKDFYGLKKVLPFSSTWLWILLFNKISQPLWWARLRLQATNSLEERRNCHPFLMLWLVKLVVKPMDGITAIWRVILLELSSSRRFNCQLCVYLFIVGVVLLINWLWNIYLMCITASFDEREGIYYHKIVYIQVFMCC